jgi:PKD repeat protein
MMQKNLRLPFLILLLLCFANWSCKKNDPVANFSFNAAYNYAPVKLTFQNLSSDATEYSWSFGDGNSSIDENPENEFTTGGQYTVTLVAKNSKKKTSLMSKEFVVLPTPRYCTVESILLEDRKNLNATKQYVSRNPDATHTTLQRQLIPTSYADDKTHNLTRILNPPLKK